jgi:hypothetical protein
MLNTRAGDADGFRVFSQALGREVHSASYFCFAPVQSRPAFVIGDAHSLSGSIGADESQSREVAPRIVPAVRATIWATPQPVDIPAFNNDVHSAIQQMPSGRGWNHELYGLLVGDLYNIRCWGPRFIDGRLLVSDERAQRVLNNFREKFIASGDIDASLLTYTSKLTAPPINEELLAEVCVPGIDHANSNLRDVIKTLNRLPLRTVRAMLPDIALVDETSGRRIYFDVRLQESHPTLIISSKDAFTPQRSAARSSRTS